MPDPTLSQVELTVAALVTGITWAGLVAFAIDGAAAARRRGLDVVGVTAAALATAVGGGTVRDLLLGRHPVGWLADPWQPAVILAIALLVTLLSVRQVEVLARFQVLMVLDALGLGLATAVGFGAAREAGLPLVSVVLLAVLSGVCGGILRDVLVQQVPRIFQRSPPYAVCATVGAVTSVAVDHLAGHGPASLLVCVTVVVLLRVTVVLRNWSLPV